MAPLFFSLQTDRDKLGDFNQLTNCWSILIWNAHSDFPFESTLRHDMYKDLVYVWFNTLDQKGFPVSVFLSVLLYCNGFCKAGSFVAVVFPFNNTKLQSYQIMHPNMMTFYSYIGWRDFHIRQQKLWNLWQTAGSDTWIRCCSGRTMVKKVTYIWCRSISTAILLEVLMLSSIPQCIILVIPGILCQWYDIDWVFFGIDKQFSNLRESRMTCFAGNATP